MTPPGDNQAADSESVNRFLESLEPKQKSVRKAIKKDWVAEHLDALLSAQTKGYTHADLSDIIRSEFEISITPGTLAKYMQAAKKQRATGDTPVKNSNLPTTQRAQPIQSTVSISQGATTPQAKPTKHINRKQQLLKGGHLSEDAIAAEFENL